MDTDSIQSPSHTRKNFDPSEFKLLVETVVKKVRALMKAHPEIEALAASGQSGLMLMGAVSYELELPQIAVRKVMDTVHDFSMVNGWLGCKGYLILDDLISSGRTCEHIVREISKQAKARMGTYAAQPKCIGVLLYEESSGNTVREMFPGLYGYRDEVDRSLADVYPIWTTSAKTVVTPAEAMRRAQKGREARLAEERKATADLAAAVKPVQEGALIRGDTTVLMSSFRWRIPSLPIIMDEADRAGDIPVNPCGERPLTAEDLAVAFDKAKDTITTFSRPASQVLDEDLPF